MKSNSEASNRCLAGFVYDTNMPVINYTLSDLAVINRKQLWRYDLINYPGIISTFASIMRAANAFITCLLRQPRTNVICLWLDLVSCSSVKQHHIFSCYRRRLWGSCFQAVCPFFVPSISLVFVVSVITWKQIWDGVLNFKTEWRLKIIVTAQYKVIELWSLGLKIGCSDVDPTLPSFTPLHRYDQLKIFRKCEFGLRYDRRV